MKSVVRLFCFVQIIFLSIDINAQTGIRLIVTNPTALERPDEIVILKRADLEKRLGLVSAYIALSVAGKEQTVQYDDLNGDGKWDEAVFLYTFKPHEKISFSIAQSPINRSNSEAQRAHVRLRKKNADDSWGPNLVKEEMPFRNSATDFSKQPLPMYLTEGPGWENDKVGFRLYFDVRNGKDIWGKRTPRMVLDSVGTVAEPSYHDLHDWGMDVLHAGKSLGAGALALLIATQNGPDTLIRLGGDDVKRTVYKQIADGPLRGVFQVTYDWEIAGKPIQVKEQISIWAGQYFYESKVWVTGAPKETKLATGIASFYNNVFQTYQKAGTAALFSYGIQSENKDNLGMAVLLPAQRFSFAGSAPNSASEILNSYLAVQAIGENEYASFRFVAAWEKSDLRFSSLSLFKAFLNREMEKMSKPVAIIWQGK